MRTHKHVQTNRHTCTQAHVKLTKTHTQTVAYLLLIMVFFDYFPLSSNTEGQNSRSPLSTVRRRSAGMGLFYSSHFSKKSKGKNKDLILQLLGKMADIKWAYCKLPVLQDATHCVWYERSAWCSSNDILPEWCYWLNLKVLPKPWAFMDITDSHCECLPCMSAWLVHYLSQCVNFTKVKSRCKHVYISILFHFLFRHFVAVPSFSVFSATQR